MIIKNNNVVVDVLSTFGDSWLGQKDKRTFYIKKTIKYGSWNIVWDPATVDDTAWTGGTVNVNAYATRTNTIREGFNYRQETETEYCTITYTPTLTDCELSGSAGAEGYTFTWGEYNITSEDRTITLIASHTSGTSTKELTQLRRDKYVISFVDQTPDDPNNETYIAYKPDIIPASGGRLNSVPYTYIVLYNTGETEEKHGILDISDKNVYASSKGVIESEKTIVTTIPGSDFGKLPAIDGVTVDFPNLIIYQAENKKYSNNDNKTVTTNIALSATPTTVYTKGGLITFTAIRTYDNYSDSYTWDSGSITPSDITHNNNEQLSEFPLTYIINDVTNTIPSTNTFNIEEYTEGDRIIPFNTYYIDADGTKTYSNIVNINQLMDYKIDGSDVYENLNVSLSYSNISEEVPYTFSASGGSLIMNDINRVTLTATYIHKWTMIEAGEQQEIITKSLAPSPEQQLLEISEYSFNVESYTANNLGTTITPINDNLATITVTVTPKGTALTQQASAVLTQQGNTEDPMPIEGSEEAVRLDVTVSPTSVSYEGGNITLEAEYFYTEKHLMTSGAEKTENKQKTVSEVAQWAYKSKTGTNPETLLQELSIGTTSHTISEIDPVSTDNVVYTYYATYKGISENGVVTQFPDQQIDEYYENLVITKYSYPTINETDYHIANTGGTLISATWPGKILTATVDHVIVYEKTGEHVLSENVNMETAIVSYSKEQISGDNLGTQEYVDNINKGTIVVTVKVSNGKDGYLTATKESNIIYQQKNAKALDTSEGATTYNNVHITSPIKGTTVDNGENTITLSLVYNMVQTYLFESGAKMQETTYNIDGTELTTWYVNGELYGTNKNSYTIAALGPTVLEDKQYIFTAKITLGTQEFSDNVTVLQKAKTVLYQKNLTLQISYPVFAEGVTYHIPASGGIAVSSNLRGTYSYIDVYSDGTESDVHTYYIDTLTDSEKVLNTKTIEYGSKGTSIASENLVMFNNALTSPKSFTLQVKPSNVKGQDGTVLTSNSATAIIKQEANEALTGDDNITISYKDFTIQNTNPVSLTNAGGTVNLIAMCTKTTATKYTSGGVKTVDEPNLTVTTDTTWSVNNVELTRGTSKYNIEAFSDFEDRTFVIDAEYQGLTDTITIIQTARVLTGEYYKDVVLHISYPVFTEDVTYHIPASGGTVDNSNVTGTFEYTKVLTYDDSSEIEQDHTTVTIGSILDTWKTWDPNTTQNIDSLGTQVKEESNTGKFIKLTIRPDNWKDKNGNNISVSDTVYIIQQKNDNGSTPTTPAYDIYDEIVLTASPTSFNNNGGTCNLTAILHYTSYTDTYTWTSGAITGGESTKNTKNISNETDVVYSAKKNDGDVSLIYTNGDSVKNVNIPSRTAGTTETDIYVFTVTTTYQDIDGNTLTASTEDVIQNGDEITSIYYENLEIKYDFNNHIIGGDIDANTHYHFDASGMNGSNESFTAGSGNYQAHATKVTVWAQQGEVRQTDVNVSNSPDDWTFTPSNNTNITASDLGTTNKARSIIQTVTATFERVDLKDKDGNNLTGSGTADVYQQENSRSTSYSISATFDISATPETNTYAQTTINLNALYQETFTYTWTSGHLQDVIQPQQDVTLNTIFSYKSSDSSVTENLGKNIISHTLSANTSHTLIKTTTYTGTYKDLTDTASVTQSPDSVDTTVNGDGIWYKDISVSWEYPYVSGTNYHVAATGGTKTISNNASSINTSNGYIPANTYYVQYKKVTRYLSGDVEDADYTKQDIIKLSISERSFDKTTVTVSSLGTTYEPDITNTGISFTLTVTPSGIKNDNGTQLSANYTVYLLQQENTYDSSSPVFTSIVVKRYEPAVKIYNKSSSIRLTATGTYHYILTTGASTANQTISLHGSQYSTYWKAFKNKSTSSYTSTFTGHNNYMEATITTRPNGTTGNVNYWFQVVYSGVNSNKLNVVQEGDYSSVSLSNLNISFNWDSYKLSGQNYHFNAQGYLGPNGSTSSGTQLDETMLNKSATATETTIWTYSGVSQSPTTKTVYPSGTWQFKANTLSDKGLTASTLSFSSNIIITGSSRGTTVDSSQGYITVTGQFVPSDSQLSSTTKTYTVYQQQNTRTKTSDHVEHTIESDTIVTWEGGTVSLEGVHWYYYVYTSNRTSGLYSEDITNTGDWYYYISTSSSTPSTTVSGRVNQKLESIPSKESTSKTYYWTWITYNGLTSTPKYICQNDGGADRTIYWYINNSDADWDDYSSSAYKQTTVSFNSYLRDAEPPSTVLIPYGADTTANFIGWYYDGSNYQDSTLRVTSSAALSLYAQWDNIRYLITWYAGSGNVFSTTGQSTAYSYVPSINGGNIWYTDDKLQFASGPGIPKKTGYTFTGFALSGTTSPQYTSAFYHDNSSDTYVAQYTIITYTITWDAETNGGTFLNGLGTTTTTAARGTKYYNITRPTAGEPRKYFDMGYYPLSSWNTNKSGTGTSASSTSAGVYENKTFYAVYSSTPTYTKAYVTYYANGGTFANGNTEITNIYSYGTIISDTYPSNPTRTNYVFDGWYWDQNCTNAVAGTEEISSQDLNIYAKWVRTYTVSFIGDDHAHWNPTSVTVRDGEKGSSVLSFDTGYEKASVSGYSSVSGNRYYSNAASSTNTNPTVQANSKPKQYTVTWYKNDINVKWSSDDTDTATYKSTTANYNTVYNDLTAPSILTQQSDSTYQYSFIEWNTSPTGSGVSKNSTSYYVTGAGVTFYAIWNLFKLPQVIWNANGGYLSDGSTQKTDTVSLGMPWFFAPKPTNPTRTNYVFKDWYNAAEGGTVLSSIDGQANPGDVLTLYAHWNPIYHITINPNGGTLTYPSTSYSDLTTTSELTIDLVYDAGNVFRYGLRDTIAKMYGDNANGETWANSHTLATILQRNGYILENLWITTNHEIVQYGNSEYFETGILVNSSYEWIYTYDVHITARWKEITYTPVFLSKT